MLSICTMFYDKNTELYEKWVNHTNKAVMIDHELIVVDNTSTQDMKEINGAKLIKAGGNMLAFEARRIGVENASGDYVFLVDPDDEVLPIPEFPYDEDMICFNYFGTTEGADKMYLCDRAYPFKYTASKCFFYNAFWKQN